ncbi:hypothetical protein EG329_006208 [Mollisiaceae sp. DMI_Dod_QoI]|nr:hypothetical protein EG329_006208 [Helotiales sp. DMI_Dod_QoI]
MDDADGDSGEGERVRASVVTIVFSPSAINPSTTQPPSRTPSTCSSRVLRRAFTGGWEVREEPQSPYSVARARVNAQNEPARHPTLWIAVSSYAKRTKRLGELIYPVNHGACPTCLDGPLRRPLLPMSLHGRAGPLSQPSASQRRGGVFPFLGVLVSWATESMTAVGKIGGIGGKWRRFNLEAFRIQKAVKGQHCPVTHDDAVGGIGGRISWRSWSGRLHKAED